MDKYERRALQLQAQGPDEFPFGYYLYLAKFELMEIPPRPDLENDNAK